MVVILHNIRSLHNIGSIFRTADATGVDKIYLVGYTSAPVDIWGKLRRQFAKVALGAHSSVFWEKEKSAAKVIRDLKAKGFIICGVEQSKKSIDYRALPKKIKRARLAIVFGNEVTGLPKEILGKCDYVLEIPMRGQKESLNVSVAVGVILYFLV